MYLLVSFNGPEDLVAFWAIWSLAPVTVDAAIVAEICAEAVKNESVVGASINEGFVAVGIHWEVLEQTGVHELVKVIGVTAELVFVSQDGDGGYKSSGANVCPMCYFGTFHWTSLD